jgi:hypothetical protein
MNITVGNFFAQDNPFAGHSRINNRNARRDRIMQDRAQEKQREIQTRLREDERINELKDRIALVHKCEESSYEQKQSLIDGMIHRITQIHESRGERAAMAAEREAFRTKALIDEATRLPDPPPPDPIKTDPEEAEEQQERATMKGLTRIAAANDNITQLRQARAAHAGEATQLRHAIESPNSNTVKRGYVPAVEVNGFVKLPQIHISAQFGYASTHDFRNQHLNKLIGAIAGLDAAVNFTISQMYRESAAQQADYVNGQRQESDSPEDCDYNV